MQTATVSQLRMSLSAYLRQVKAGEEVVITEHGLPIARLLPLPSAASVPEHVRDLEARGLLKRGRKPRPADFRDLPRPADPQGAVRAAARRERDESW